MSQRNSSQTDTPDSAHVDDNLTQYTIGFICLVILAPLFFYVCVRICGHCKKKRLRSLVHREQIERGHGAVSHKCVAADSEPNSEADSKESFDTDLMMQCTKKTVYTLATERAAEVRKLMGKNKSPTPKPAPKTWRNPNLGLDISHPSQFQVRSFQNFHWEFGENDNPDILNNNTNVYTLIETAKLDEKQAKQEKELHKIFPLHATASTSVSIQSLQSEDQQSSIFSTHNDKCCQCQSAELLPVNKSVYHKSRHLLPPDSNNDNGTETSSQPNTSSRKIKSESNSMKADRQNGNVQDIDKKESIRPESSTNNNTVKLETCPNKRNRTS